MGLNNKRSLSAAPSHSINLLRLQGFHIITEHTLISLNDFFNNDAIMQKIDLLNNVVFKWQNLRETIIVLGVCQQCFAVSNLNREHKKID